MTDTRAIAAATGLIVVGASAGGVAALRRLARDLPASLNLPVLVVLHVGAHPSILPQIMSDEGPLPAQHAVDGQEMEPGCIYVAPPDHHMLVDGGHVRLNRGPKEHHVRPAIDPLFRSAALSHGPGVIGVVLTGMLDDGTPGLQAIKRGGGTAVVQDPNDAAHPSMPLSATRHVEIDHCVPIAEMGALLASLAPRPAKPASVDEDELTTREQALMLFEGDGMENLSAIARPSPFVCPDCHGGLWEIADSNPLRFRCHVGHGYTIRTLQHAMGSAADDAIWAALRALQEQGQLLKKMARSFRASGDDSQAKKLEEVAAEIDTQGRQLHEYIDKRAMPIIVD